MIRNGKTKVPVRDAMEAGFACRPLGTKAVYLPLTPAEFTGTVSVDEARTAIAIKGDERILIGDLQRESDGSFTGVILRFELSGAKEFEGLQIGDTLGFREMHIFTYTGGPSEPYLDPRAKHAADRLHNEPTLEANRLESDETLERAGYEERPLADAGAPAPASDPPGNLTTGQWRFLGSPSGYWKWVYCDENGVERASRRFAGRVSCEADAIRHGYNRLTSRYIVLTPQHNPTADAFEPDDATESERIVVDNRSAQSVVRPQSEAIAAPAESADPGASARILRPDVEEPARRQGLGSLALSAAIALAIGLPAGYFLRDSLILPTALPKAQTSGPAATQLRMDYELRTR